MIREAKGLFATTNSDNDNIVIALTAKQLNPSLRVVCRCNDTKNIDKIKRAGADTVVALNYIGGLRMASDMTRPHATDFLESMLHDREQALRVEEVRVPEDSKYMGRLVGDLDFTNMGNMLLLAVRKEGGKWIYNPPASTRARKRYAPDSPGDAGRAQTPAIRATIDGGRAGVSRRGLGTVSAETTERRFSAAGLAPTAESRLSRFLEAILRAAAAAIE